MKGIYKIRNTINDKIYIGQSVDIKERIVWHKEALRGDYHYNKHLKRAWDKYGEENFEFTIEVENDLFDKDYLNILEELYIALYNSFHKGYNQTSGGDGCTVSKETREKLKALGKERGICEGMISYVDSKKVKIKATNKITGDIYKFKSIKETVAFTGVHSWKLYGLLRKTKHYNVDYIFEYDT